VKDEIVILWGDWKSSKVLIVQRLLYVIRLEVVAIFKEVWNRFLGFVVIVDQFHAAVDIAFVKQQKLRGRNRFLGNFKVVV